MKILPFFALCRIRQREMNERAFGEMKKNILSVICATYANDIKFVETPLNALQTSAEISSRKQNFYVP